MVIVDQTVAANETITEVDNPNYNSDLASLQVGQKLKITLGDFVCENVILPFQEEPPQGSYFGFFWKSETNGIYFLELPQEPGQPRQAFFEQNEFATAQISANNVYVKLETVDDTISYDTPGEYELTYTATDACGNTTTETRDITVNADEWATLIDKTVEFNDEGNTYDFTLVEYQSLLTIQPGYEVRITIGAGALAGQYTCTAAETPISGSFRVKAGLQYGTHPFTDIMVTDNGTDLNWHYYTEGDNQWCQYSDYNIFDTSLNIKLEYKVG